MELGEVQGDGCTMRDHLESQYRQSGIMPPDLVPIECHPAVRYVFDYWISLNRRRRGFDQPVTDLDIFAWSSLRGIRLNFFELSVLEKLEELYFAISVKPKIDEMRKPKP